MDKILIIKIVFGSLLSVDGLVLILLGFLLYYKYMVQEKRCTKRTMGTVKKYTLSSRGGKYSGIFLPVVYYTAGGGEYKVTGPEYKYYVTKSKSSPVSNNEISTLIKEQVFHTNVIMNSIAGIKKNPMAALFPVGSQVEVFYDESKPKLAYVMRYCNKKRSFYTMVLSGVATLIIALLVIILL